MGVPILEEQKIGRNHQKYEEQTKHEHRTKIAVFFAKDKIPSFMYSRLKQKRCRF